MALMMHFFVIVWLTISPLAFAFLLPLWAYTFFSGNVEDSTKKD